MNGYFFSLTFIGICLLGVNNCVSAEESNTSSSKTAQAFKFEQYPAIATAAGINIKPILSTKLAKRYKTVISLAMAEPANFAGNYRVASWGCGTDCRGFAIINKLSELHIPYLVLNTLLAQWVA